jgi:oxygen-independent coproporphyrinogen-3 oxidase
LAQASDEGIVMGLQELKADGIVELKEEGLWVTENGRAFIRNVCHVFDKRMRRQQAGRVPVFSRAI